MKRTLLTLIIAIMALTARAISYDDARQQAWFITDKMAYELNLTPEQYDRAYQINLDYLMSLNGPADITGTLWQYRDADLRCILFDWQYNLLRTLDYFFRPVRWYTSRWYYPVYDHYRIGYYYYTRPNIYISYRGGMWHHRRPDRPSPYATWRPQRGAGMRGHGPATPPPFNPGRPDRHNPRPGNPGPGRHDRPNPGYPGNPGQPNGGRPGRPNGNPNPGRPDNNYNPPRRPDNNRGNGNNPTARPAFRDTYTNYRQTGNDTPQRGTGRPTNPRGGRGFTR